VLSEVMDFYGLERDFQGAGFLRDRAAPSAHESDPADAALRETRGHYRPRRVGQNAVLHRFETILKQEGRLMVARSLRSTKTAPSSRRFYDLAPEKNPCGARRRRRSRRRSARRRRSRPYTRC
jgi:hypothetical protein